MKGSLSILDEHILKVIFFFPQLNQDKRLSSLSNVSIGILKRMSSLFTCHDMTTEMGSLDLSGVPSLEEETCKTLYFNTVKSHSLLQTGQECIISLAQSLTTT